MPAIDRIAPTGSTLGAAGSLDVGMRNTPATSPSTTIGTLMRNTACQEKFSTRNPPSSGPSTPASPAVADHRPMALPRSSTGNTTVMIDSVAGMMKAPPMPMNARVAMSCVELSDIAAATEPTPNTTKPNCSAPTRPKRSPSAPAVSRSPANTST